MKSDRPAEFTKNPGNQGAIRWLCPMIVAVVTCVSFFPALSNGFVDWDDFENLVDNPHYRGLGWGQLLWMFTTFHMGPYQPLSWMTLGLDYWLWGINPLGYHLTNLLIHTGNALFCYVISRRLLSVAFSISEAEGGWRLNLSAAVSALLFAIHPLRVESVAWATERRDVLSGFFYFWTIDCYVRAHSSQQIRADPRRSLRTALAVYVLSLLSKATAITLPVVLLVFDIYPLKRLPWNPRAWLLPETRAVLREKFPFLVAASLFAGIALLGQHQASAFRSLDTYGVSSRLGQAFYGASFYLWKTLVPLKLSPLYEIPPNFSPWNLQIFIGAATTIIVALSLYRLRNRWPAGLACWLYYVVVLAPVLGIVQTGPQLVADRYSYLSCLSWAVLAGGMIFYCQRSFKAKYGALSVSMVVPGAALAIVLVLASLAWTQTKIWRDTETLWGHVIALNPDSSIAHYNLGRYLAKHGNSAVAISHYREALRVRPDDAEARNNLGLLLAQQGEIEASLEEFRKAVQFDPNYAKAFFNMGRVLARQGDLENAVRHYERALALSSNEFEIHLGLGRLLAARGNLDDAANRIQEALRLKSDSADAHVALARILAAKGDKGRAEKHYQEALRLLKAQSQVTPRP